MKHVLSALFSIVVLVLASCQYRPGTTTEVVVQPSSTAIPESTAVAEIATSVPASTEPTVQSTVAANPTDSAQPVPENVAEPTLIEIAWDDRSVFQDGLIAGEQQVLENLHGATIYHLDIDITDPHQVVGKMEARYTNQESEALNDLALHLFPEHLGGQIEINNVLVDGKPAAISIENGMLRVSLDSPLAPGDQTVLALDFITTVPGEESTKYHVLAFDEGILALAHFYPMFAVYDDQGWHTEPSADHGDETFGDMSFFLVQVRSPAAFQIAASGIDVAGQGDENFKGTLFAAGPMRDFYLAASPDYEVVQQQVGPVLVNSYAPAGSIDGAQLALEVTAEALQSFNNRFGQYPYSELDIVSTPTEALGIEYPGVFANALRIYDLADNPYGVPNSVMLESTTAHEAAHQWFYGTIGSDQLNEPWLDESVTQYATWLYYVDRYGAQNASGFFNSFEGRVARATDPNLPIGLPADAYSGVDYGAIVYGRGPILLDELANLMGQETFDEFLLDYSTQFRWGIATAQDFQGLAEEHCQCDLSQFFAENVRGE